MGAATVRAMDFFAAQEHARGLSRRLVLMFALALVAILAAVNLIALLGWMIAAGAPRAGALTALFATTSIVTLCIIGAVSLFRIVQLAGGGAAIARMVAARRVEAATAVPAERRLTHTLYAQNPDGMIGALAVVLLALVALGVVFDIIPRDMLADLVTRIVLMAVIVLAAGGALLVLLRR